ncbi:CsbD family protein, partial [Enterococcus faecium]
GKATDDKSKETEGKAQSLGADIKEKARNLGDEVKDKFSRKDEKK